MQRTISAFDPKRTSIQFLGLFISSASRGNDDVKLWLRSLARVGGRLSVSAGGAAAEERVAAVRLESRYGDAGRHVELLQNLTALRIDPTQFAFLVFKGAVPEFAVHPGDAGHEAV